MFLSLLSFLLSVLFFVSFVSTFFPVVSQYLHFYFYFSLFRRKCEMAHLRLAAGSAMLRICEQKGVGDQFTLEQFYNLSRLMKVRSAAITATFSCFTLVNLLLLYLLCDFSVL